MLDVTPGTVVVFGDIACPWAHLCVHGLRQARRRLGLCGAVDPNSVDLDLRSFPLELFNERPTPKRTLDAEIPVVGALDPSAGWQMWQRPDYEYPVTTLPALEAVQAAKARSLRASEELGRALRYAFFAESRTVSLLPVILDVAKGCRAVDVDDLAQALEDGRARNAVLEQKETAERIGVKGSPHVYLPDGSDHANPGIEKHWEGEEGEGFPVVDGYNPSVYDDLIRRAASR
ncbi:MAG: DsbA family protein [Acidimicrobiia bacterium]|nr:DsbA family protein [Acidimicrobiia bacterium]